MGYCGVLLSQENVSRTQVVKVKGVSFNFLQFMWSSYGQIKQVQARRDYATALTLLTELIRWLPDSIKEEFRKKAIMLETNISLIQSGKLKKIRNIPDFYLKGIYKNRLLQAYSDISFKTLIDDLGSKLNNLGYMENVEKLTEGEDDWYAEQRKEQMRRKRAAKKEEKKQPRSEAEKFSKIDEEELSWSH